MPDVGADVEKFVSRDRLEQPFAESSSDARAHVQQGEGDNADVSAPIAQIELEWDLALQRHWIGGVVNEDGAIPARVEHRLAAHREHPASSRFTQPAATGGDTLHF